MYIVKMKEKTEKERTLKITIPMLEDFKMPSRRNLMPFKALMQLVLPILN